MTEIPELPAEFESEDELEQYLERLYDHIEVLEETVDESEKRKREFTEELNQIEEHVSASSEELEEIHAVLEELVQRMESIELHGGPSDVGLKDSLRNPDFGGN